MTEVSIIVRSKNEEKWIGACLEMIFSQSYRDFEVILVDNCSTDRTIEKAKQFNVKILNYDDTPFHPGLAINSGIEASSGRLVAIISAHCIPTNNSWLENLIRNFNDDRVAGVYGRQEPLPFTNDLDKRDLHNIFGLDKKIQKKDPFFHNANSMIKRDIWKKLPFDEETLHIEDRIWAQAVLAQDYKIIYEPEASVYHYHGINQGRNIDRAKRIVRILEKIHCPNNQCVIEGLNIAAIIPSRGKPLIMNGRPLIERTIRAAKSSRYVNKIIVASDTDDTLNIAESLGSHSIKRPPNLSGDFIGLVRVYQYVLDQLKEDDFWPDIIVLLEEIYPFRPEGIVDRLIEGMLDGGYESVITANPEYGSIWRKDNGEMVRVDQGLMPSKLKEPLYRGLIGLGCATQPSVLMAGHKIGKQAGLIKVDDAFSSIAIHNDVDLKIAEMLESKYQEIERNN